MLVTGRYLGMEDGKVHKSLPTRLSDSRSEKQNENDGAVRPTVTPRMS
jgi:hypothetical protein